MRFETKCVHVGVDKDSSYLSVITPIYPSSTLQVRDDLKTNRDSTTRSGNPTRRSKKTSLLYRGESTAAMRVRARQS
ncbi:MAG: hypothetical protein U0903_10650 [Planctomycetales bacterium]